MIGAIYKIGWKKLPYKKLSDVLLVPQRKRWRRKKMHIYPSLCSGLTIEKFQERNIDSAENLHDNFIQLFLMPDQLLAPLKKRNNT